MALVPLTLWFLFSLLLLPSLDFAVIRAWMAVPMSGLLSVLLVAVLTYHAYLGTNVDRGGLRACAWTEIAVDGVVAIPVRAMRRREHIRDSAHRIRILK